MRTVFKLLSTMKYLFLFVSCLVLLTSSIQVVSGISHGCTPDLIPQGLDFLSNPFAGGSIGAASGTSGFSSGFVLSNGTFSNEMSRLSCLTREIAIYLKASIISRTQHVLVRIADSSLGISSEELHIVLDTFSGFIRLTYNHQTQPHVETISIDRNVFLLRKWQQIVFLFSGNQFVVIVDCAVRLSLTIPTPDLCFSSASTITVGNPGALSPSITFKSQPHMSGIIFGNKGYMSLCPNLKYDCPTCAESHSLRQRIRELEGQLEEKMDEISSLQQKLSGLTGSEEMFYFQRLEFFEKFRQSQFLQVLRDSPNTAAGGVGNDDSCLLNDNVILNGQFFQYSFPNKNNANCMCFFGKVLCENNVQRRQSLYPGCTIGGVTLPANSYRVRKIGGFACTLIACGDLVNRANDEEARRTYICGTMSSSQCLAMRDSSRQSDLYLYRKMVCCGDCNPCEGHPCPSDANCIENPSDGNHSCICPPGKYQAGDRCVPKNECLNKSTCPQESTCVDKAVGHFCDCTNSNSTPGYKWNVQTNQCEDIDECSGGTVECPPFTRCENLKGSYHCVCDSGYQMSNLTGQCEPHCDPGCRNGGVCLFGNICVCPPGFTGNRCEEDIDECLTAVCGANEMCVNTLGSYQCVCKPGYERRGDRCENVDECMDDLLNICIQKNRCVDTDGGFQCRCVKHGIVEGCTGMCRYSNEFIPNGGTFINNKCKDCVCVNGAIICQKMNCNCSDPAHTKDACCKKSCQTECMLPDGTTIPRGESGTTQDGCNECECSRNRILNCTRVDCPDISHCPENLRVHPDGSCCPMCKVPKCGGSGVQDGTSVMIDNGCTNCLCQNGQWSCSPAVKCLELNCDENDMVYHPGQCCPTCREIPELTPGGAVGC